MKEKDIKVLIKLEEKKKKKLLLRGTLQYLLTQPYMIYCVLKSTSIHEPLMHETFSSFFTFHVLCELSTQAIPKVLSLKSSDLHAGKTNLNFSFCCCHHQIDGIA